MHEKGCCTEQVFPVVPAKTCGLFLTTQAEHLMLRVLCKEADHRTVNVSSVASPRATCVKIIDIDEENDENWGDGEWEIYKVESVFGGTVAVFACKVWASSLKVQEARRMAGMREPNFVLLGLSKLAETPVEVATSSISAGRSGLSSLSSQNELLCTD